MISKNISKQPKAIVDIQIIVPWADVQKTWDQTLQRLSQDIELPGFRKGQAPAPMVEQYVGSKLGDEVIKVLMPQALMEALQGTNIVPIDYPKYQVVSFQKGQDFKFNAQITERPTIQVGNYKGIKAPRPALKTTTDEEVEKIVQDLFKRWKARQPQAQATGNSGQATGTQGSAGSMSFNAAPSGQQPQATPAPQTDQPNDQFAQAVGATSLADLKSKIRQDLDAEAKYNNELDYEEAILQEVEKITNVDIPDILIQDELNRMLVSLQRTVSERGMLMDDYLKSQKKDVDGLKREWKVQAEKNVRMELGLSEIARQEGVNISDQELQAEIDKIQDQRVKAQFAQDEPKMHLRHALRQTKTLNLLKTIVG